MVSKINIRKTTGLVLLVVLILHVSLSLYITIFPGRIPLGNSYPAQFYKYFVHLGPFFETSRLKYHRHFVVGFKYQEKWTEFDLTEAEVSGYRSNIFAINNLTRRDFLNRNALEFHSDGQSMGSEPFRKLHAFVRTQYINNTRPDSIRWIFKHLPSAPAGSGIPAVIIFDFMYEPPDAE